MKLLSVASNGQYIELPTPSTYSAIPQDVDKAGRNVNGDLYIENITTKFAISASWNAITPEQKNLLMALTTGKSLNVRYFDLTTSTIKYGLFYRGNDLAITPLVRYDGTDFIAYKVDTLSLVER